MTEEEDEEDRPFFEDVPADNLKTDVMAAVDETFYPDNYQTPERKKVWREVRLQMAKVERKAQILADREEEREKDVIVATQSNVRAAASAAQSVEQQVAVCQSLIAMAVESATTDTFRLSYLEPIARVLSASAAAAQVLGRLRDGYSRVERHVILEDRRNRRRQT